MIFCDEIVALAWKVEVPDAWSQSYLAILLYHAPAVIPLWLQVCNGLVPAATGAKMHRHAMRFADIQLAMFQLFGDVLAEYRLYLFQFVHFRLF